MAVRGDIDALRNPQLTRGIPEKPTTPDNVLYQTGHNLYRWPGST